MKQPLLSVIVPAYNAGPWLERCLESIIKQTYQNLEIIVIDDGSTDCTPRIIEKYSKKDSRVQAIHQSNHGLAETRSTGIAQAKGDFVGFVDADDYIDVNMYQHLIENALRYDADISHCGMNFCEVDGRIEAHYGTNKLVISDTNNALVALLTGREIEPSMCNKIYRKDLLLNSCLDNKIFQNEDMLRNFVAFQRARHSVYEDFCGYQYVQHPPESRRRSISEHIAAEREYLRVGQLMDERASDVIRPYTVRRWYATAVNAFSLFAGEKDAEATLFVAECRAFLKEHKKDLHYLSLRYYLAAETIRFCPKLYLLLYRLFRKLKKRK